MRAESPAWPPNASRAPSAFGLSVVRRGLIERGSSSQRRPLRTWSSEVPGTLQVANEGCKMLRSRAGRCRASGRCSRHSLVSMRARCAATVGCWQGWSSFQAARLKAGLAARYCVIMERALFSCPSAAWAMASHLLALFRTVTLGQNFACAPSSAPGNLPP
jgi:hypothetical protein